MNSSDVKKIASFDDIIEQHQLSRDALKALEKRLSQQANMDEFQFTSLQKEAFNKEGFWRGDPKTDSQHVIVQGGDQLRQDAGERDGHYGLPEKQEEEYCAGTAEGYGEGALRVSAGGSETAGDRAGIRFQQRFSGSRWRHRERGL